MCENNSYCSYHSDSDFSDFSNPGESSAPPKKQAPTLMDILCGEGKDPDLVLSPRQSGGFLSFSEAASSAISDHKSGLSHEDRVFGEIK